jgi:hypothetical protein
MNEYTDKAEKTRDSSPAGPEECINMQEHITLAPTLPAWPNSYEAMMARMERLLDAIDQNMRSRAHPRPATEEEIAAIISRLQEGTLFIEIGSVDRSGALRDVSIVSRTHSTVPTEKPRTEALSRSQRVLCPRCGCSSVPESPSEQNTTLVPGSEEAE